MSLLPILRLRKLKGIPKLSHSPSRISVTNTYRHGTRNQANHLHISKYFPISYHTGEIKLLRSQF